MAKLKRVAALGVLGLIVSAGVSTTAFAGANKDHKVEVCHQAAHKYVQISVARQALSAHMAHGDVLADEYGECS